MFQSKAFKKCERWVDFLSLASLVGVWPRFIEPNLCFVTKKTLFFPDLPPAFENLRVVQFSDIHWGMVRPRFIKRAFKKIQSLQPDLLLFTGDWITYGALADEENFKKLLCLLHAPLGCFGILGNHDYAEYVTQTDRGPECLKELPTLSSTLAKYLRRGRARQSSPDAFMSFKEVPLHEPLLKCLKETPFRILHNECVQLKVKGEVLTLCGLGDLWLSRFQPDVAFKDYQEGSFGIVMTHNPDTFQALNAFPGNIMLAGHTHGGQVNLPWIGQRLHALEYPAYKKGAFLFPDFQKGSSQDLSSGFFARRGDDHSGKDRAIFPEGNSPGAISEGKSARDFQKDVEKASEKSGTQVHNRWAYVNRGLGAHRRWRIGASPEILLLTLKRKP